MSDQQLQKFRMERDALAQELKLIKGALPTEKASEKLVESMQNKTDPFNETDNPWVIKEGSSGGCCSIQ
jgi:hypothetical protein